MKTELFADLPETPSPKLAWLRKHGLETRFDPELADCPDSPETGDTCYPWVCGALDGRVEPYGVGETEDDAIWDYCHKNDLTHYSLE